MTYVLLPVLPVTAGTICRQLSASADHLPVQVPAGGIPL
jgi:hypothetical protein